MNRQGVWHDDYWLLVMQLYLRKPKGVKPLYSRLVVKLGMELHIAPQVLVARMQQLSRLQTPRIERLWNTYRNDPQRLSRAVKLLRSMNGFGAPDQFYEGVEVQETFEKDFRPVAQTTVIPAMLILILNLYFQLTPATMVTTTPEVKELAQKLKMSATDVVKILDIFQNCDPYLNRNEMIISPLLLPCQQVWQRFGNHEPIELQTYAKQLEDYFK